MADSVKTLQHQAERARKENDIKWVGVLYESLFIIWYESRAIIWLVCPFFSRTKLFLDWIRSKSQRLKSKRWNRRLVFSLVQIQQSNWLKKAPSLKTILSSLNLKVQNVKSSNALMKASFEIDASSPLLVGSRAQLWLAKVAIQWASFWKLF